MNRLVIADTKTKKPTKWTTKSKNKKREKNPRQKGLLNHLVRMRFYASSEIFNGFKFKTNIFKTPQTQSQVSKEDSKRYFTCWSEINKITLYTLVLLFRIKVCALCLAKFLHWLPPPPPPSSTLVSHLKAILHKKLASKTRRGSKIPT